MRPCSSCGAPVLDLKHERTGHLAPIDAQPLAHGGNIVVDLEAGTYRVLDAKERQAHYAQSPRSGLYKSHFATCPDAPQFRERLKPKGSRP